MHIKGPTPKVGIDQNTAIFLLEIFKEYSDLYQLTLKNDLNLDEKIKIITSINKFNDDYLRYIANKPEMTYALNELNTIWNTNFSSFDYLLNYLDTVKNKTLSSFISQ